MSKKEQIVKLKILESRIERWRDVGDACTEKQWDNMNKDLTVVKNFIRALERVPNSQNENVQKILRKNHLNRVHMKMLNIMWHQYKTKEINR